MIALDIPKIPFTEDVVRNRNLAHSKRFAKLLNSPLLDIEVKFSNRMTSSYGISDGPEKTIIYSLKLMKQCSMVFDYIIGHEVCHQYVDWRSGEFEDGPSHCKIWRTYMNRAGLPDITSFDEEDLYPYITYINKDWYNLSEAQLSNPRTILIKYNIHE